MNVKCCLFICNTYKGHALFFKKNKLDIKNAYSKWKAMRPKIATILNVIYIIRSELKVGN